MHIDCVGVHAIHVGIAEKGTGRKRQSLNIRYLLKANVTIGLGVIDKRVLHCALHAGNDRLQLFSGAGLSRRDGTLKTDIVIIQPLNKTTQVNYATY